MVAAVSTPAAAIWQAAVAAAVRAPSIHNSQPWRFVADGERLHLYADPRRHLREVDPTGRSLHVSCGAALLHVELAVHTAGRECLVNLLPDPSDRLLLATVTLGGHRERTIVDERLAEAILERHTHREPFTGEPVPTPVLHQWRHGVAVRGAWLHVLQRGTEVALNALLAQADEAQRCDPAYLHELAAWTRDDGHEGVPARAWRDSEVISCVPMREFDSRPRPRTQLNDAPPPVEHPQLVLIGTDGDDARAWLRTGMAMEWLLLAATSNGLAASPLTQVLDWPAYRSRVAPLLGLTGHVQMILRVGYPTTRIDTPRRPLTEVLSGG